MKDIDHLCFVKPITNKSIGLRDKYLKLLYRTNVVARALARHLRRTRNGGSQ